MKKRNSLGWGRQPWLQVKQESDLQKLCNGCLPFPPKPIQEGCRASTDPTQPGRSSGGTAVGRQRVLGALREDGCWHPFHSYASSRIEALPTSAPTPKRSEGKSLKGKLWVIGHAVTSMALGIRGGNRFKFSLCYYKCGKYSDRLLQSAELRNLCYECLMECFQPSCRDLVCKTFGMCRRR